MKHIRLCLTLAMLLVSSCRLSSSPPAAPEIFVLMGQSNMSGRGVLAEAPAELLSADPRISVYGNDGILRAAVEPIDSSANQIDAISIDAQPGVGPGLVFAKRLAERDPRRRFILIPCAKGGSSIDGWARAKERSTLYGSCLARVLEARGKGRLAGLLWYQGETDAGNVEQAASWSAKFARVVESFRADIGAPALRVMVVGLGDPPASARNPDDGPRAWRIVQQAQRTLSLPNVVHVPAAGLPRKADQLHLSTAGQLMLGQRMADAWRAGASPDGN
jgi:hypothetical protein